jgi:hypothetical protein
MVGFAARGLVLGIVGVFLIQAARDYEPERATGIDGALRRLADTPRGPWWLGVVACGLAAFGAFRLVDAWLRTPAET